MTIPTAPEYEVHAIRYGRHERRRLSENFIPPLPEPADLHDAPMPIDFYVWVVIGGGRTVLVDTGFDRAEGEYGGESVGEWTLGHRGSQFRMA